MYLHKFFSLIVSVITGFFGFSLPIGYGQDTFETMPLIITMLGYLIYSIMQLVMMELLVFTFHDASMSVKKLRDAAEDLPVDESNQRRIKRLVRDIEELEPLSGFGMFSVDRTTVTSIASIKITYLIIMIQFKQSSL